MKLNEERERINQMIQSFEDLNQEEIDGSINISQNYTSFVLLLILALVFIYVTYILSVQPSSNSMTTNTTMFQQGGKLGISTFFIIFIIILISLVIKYFSNISSFIKSFQ